MGRFICSILDRFSQVPKVVHLLLAPVSSDDQQCSSRILLGCNRRFRGPEPWDDKPIDKVLLYWLKRRHFCCYCIPSSFVWDCLCDTRTVCKFLDVNLLVCLDKFASFWRAPRFTKRTHKLVWIVFCSGDDVFCSFAKKGTKSVFYDLRSQEETDTNGKDFRCSN